MMRAKLLCYMPFVSNEIKKALVYKTSFFVLLLSRFLSVLVTYYLWTAIYSSSPDDIIGGFRLQEMVAFVIVSFFTNTMISSVSIMDIAGDVLKGDIAMSLVKPIDYQGICLARASGKLSVSFLVYVLPFYVIFTFAGLLPLPGAVDALLYIISVILGFTVSYYFSFCFAMIAFRTIYFFGINLAKDSLISILSGSLVPLSFFGTGIRTVLSVLPFSSMVYYPIMIYLGKLSAMETVKALVIQAIWAGAFFIIGRAGWKSVIRRIVIVGG